MPGSHACVRLLGLLPHALIVCSAVHNLSWSPHPLLTLLSCLCASLRRVSCRAGVIDRLSWLLLRYRIYRTLRLATFRGRAVFRVVFTDAQLGTSAVSWLSLTDSTFLLASLWFYCWTTSIGLPVLLCSFWCCWFDMVGGVSVSTGCLARCSVAAKNWCWLICFICSSFHWQWIHFLI